MEGGGVINGVEKIGFISLYHDSVRWKKSMIINVSSITNYNNDLNLLYRKRIINVYK